MDSIIAQAVQTAVQAARDELTTQSTTEIQALRAENQTLRAQVKALERASSTTLRLPSATPRLPDVMKLDGPKWYEAWLLELKGKLRVDGAAIGDDCALTFYIYSRLEPNVKELVLPQVREAERTDTWEGVPERMLQTIKQSYRQPKKATSNKPHLKRTEMSESDSFQSEQSSSRRPVDTRPWW